MTDQEPNVVLILNIFFSVYIVFIPLFWGWIRGALIVVQKLHAGKLQRPTMWRFILDFVPALTVSLLFTVIIYVIGLLTRPAFPAYVKVAGTAVIFVLGIPILLAAILVWLTLRSEI